MSRQFSLRAGFCAAITLGLVYFLSSSNENFNAKITKPTLRVEEPEPTFNAKITKPTLRVEEPEPTKVMKLAIEEDNPYIHMHDHCEAFAYANTIRLNPKLSHVYGDAWNNYKDLIPLFAIELTTPVLNRVKKSGSTLKIFSIGSGNCDIENKIAFQIKQLFDLTAVFTCFDPFGNQFADQGNGFIFTDKLSPIPLQDGFFAHHALHHVSDLNEMYSYVSRYMAKDGAFVMSDMAGFRGHKRWPEQLIYAQKYFGMLFDLKKKFVNDFDFVPKPDAKNNHPMMVYPDVDYSCDLAEGIMVHEVLPLLHKYFYIEKMVAFGGFDFEFIGKRMCGNIQLQNSADVAFMDNLLQAQENAVSSGQIKPDQIIAVARHFEIAAEVTQKYWMHWTPEFVTRRFDSTEIVKAPECKRN